jgi:hypothetical protein
MLFALFTKDSISRSIRIVLLNTQPAQRPRGIQTHTRFYRVASFVLLNRLSSVTDQLFLCQVPVNLQFYRIIQLTILLHRA